MSFVNRLFSYVFNELMVNALANSRTFQRFAVKSDALMKEAAADGRGGVGATGAAGGAGLVEERV